MDKEKSHINFWRHDEMGARTQTSNHSDKDYHPGYGSKKNPGVNHWERWVNRQTQLQKQSKNA